MKNILNTSLNISCLLLLALLILTQCKPEPHPDPIEPEKPEETEMDSVKAAFSWTGATIVPATIEFQNTSEFSDSWLWDFGDGETSTDKSPTHTFTEIKTYTVSLKATGPTGTDSISKTITITPMPHPPIPAFIEGLYKGLTVQHRKLHRQTPGHPIPCDTATWCHYYDTIPDVEVFIYRSQYDSVLVVGAPDLPALNGSYVVCYGGEYTHNSQPYYRFGVIGGNSEYKASAAFYPSDTTLTFVPIRGQGNTTSFICKGKKIGGLGDIDAKYIQSVANNPCY